jgi:VanZ family protein
MTLPLRPTPSAIAARLFTAAAAVAAVAALTLAPQRLVGPARGLFMDLAWPLLSEWSYTEIESTLNALLFLPLGLALALLLGRWWVLAAPAGFAMSFAVEVAQARIPGRVPDLDDVLWNTVGAAAGAVLVGIIRGVAALVRAIARRQRTERAG